MSATADINNVIITGRLTRDIEIRSLKNGTPIGSLGLAYSGVKRNQQTGEYEEVSNFIDCYLYGTRAQALQQYLVKGTKVAISGELRYRSWEKDGQRRSKHEIMIDRIQFMSSQKRQEAPAEQAQEGPDTWSYDYPF